MRARLVKGKTSSKYRSSSEIVSWRTWSLRKKIKLKKEVKASSKIIERKSSFPIRFSFAENSWISLDQRQTMSLAFCLQIVISYF